MYADLGMSRQPRHVRDPTRRVRSDLSFLEVKVSADAEVGGEFRNLGSGEIESAANLESLGQFCNLSSLKGEVSPNVESLW